MTNIQSRLKSVAIIGAGIAGLCALRHFTSRLDRFGPIVAYEQTAQVGGTWNYTDRVGFEENGLPVHTSMYKDLRANAPAHIMQFPDFTWNYSCSFPHQSEILEFINAYAKHFNLFGYIQFEHHLEHLARVDEANCWQLTVRDMKTGNQFSRDFDIVILAPGRNFIPLIPKIETLDRFTGRIIHAHDYRTREMFTGQRVAVVGAGPSGFDIALQVSTVATAVYFINRTEIQYENLPESCQQMKGTVSEFGPTSMKVKMVQQQPFETIELQIDAIIWATGYRIYLNYLDQEECGLRLNEDDTLDGIYRHFVNIRYPTMALLSIIRPSINLPLYHTQVQYYIKLLLGEITTPTSEQMHQEVAQEITTRRAAGIRDADRHLLKIPLLKEYLKQLQAEANLERTPAVLFDLLEEVYRVRRVNPRGYKEINYRIVGQRFEVI